jgi:peptidyl-prolyl cis-trans isomerase A (cyclophilin A)
MTTSLRIAPLSLCAASLLLGTVGTSCKTAPAEPEPPAKETAATNAVGKAGEPAASASATSASTAAAPATAATAPLDGTKGGDDPLNGSFTMADATKDLKGTGPIVAKIDTSKGTLQCKLFDDKAPITVANFIGLATGKRPWKDPSGSWVKKPAYDGTTFHRIIKGFMIQGGDARGNGTGEPGYVIKDERWQGATHDRAGLLCMANRGPNTNGAQFFITDAAAPHLDRSYTIFGECAPEQTIHDIANVPVAGEHPTTPVTIKTVTISRDDKKK